jgi:hypothetical protein
MMRFSRRRAHRHLPSRCARALRRGVVGGDGGRGWVRNTRRGSLGQCSSSVALPHAATRPAGLSRAVGHRRVCGSLVVPFAAGGLRRSVGRRPRLTFHRAAPARCGGFDDQRRIVDGDQGGRVRHVPACAPPVAVFRCRTLTAPSSGRQRVKLPPFQPCPRCGAFADERCVATGRGGGRVRTRSARAAHGAGRLPTIACWTPGGSPRCQGDWQVEKAFEEAAFSSSASVLRVPIRAGGGIMQGAPGLIPAGPTEVRQCAECRAIRRI